MLHITPSQAAGNLFNKLLKNEKFPKGNLNNITINLCSSAGLFMTAIRVTKCRHKSHAELLLPKESERKTRWCKKKKSLHKER